MTAYALSDVTTVAIIALFGATLGSLSIKYTWLSLRNKTERERFSVVIIQLCLLVAKAILVYSHTANLWPLIAYIATFSVFFWGYSAR